MTPGEALLAHTLNRGRVLVVDDDVDVADGVKEILSEEGYAAEIAANSAQALEIIRNFDARVALLDMRLGAENGLDLLDRLGEDYPDLVCVIITGNADKESAIHSLRRGAYDYLQKPLDPDDLFSVVERGLEKAELTAQNRRVMESLVKAKEGAEKANKAKSAFLANISHELRTPLNAMIGFSEVLMGEMFGPLGSARYVEYAKDIHTSGQQLLEIINDILDITKAEADKLPLRESPTRIQNAINSCLTVLKEHIGAAHLSVVNNVGGDFPLILGDEVRLRQIMLNLLSNAVKFTEPGGTVTIGGKCAPGEDAFISIRDTGIGIAAEDIPKVLLPFGQVDTSLARKYDGTGLGLPMAVRLMQLHGGDLTLQSEPGTGTVVTLRMPKERVLAEGPGATANANPAAETDQRPVVAPLSGTPR